MKKMSETIGDFLDLLDDARKKYDWAYEQVGIEDKRSVDLEHAIEFTDDPEKLLDYAKRLHQCRVDRRDYKDIVGQTYIINYWADKNAISINYLRETLGRLRQEEQNQQSRVYSPRVESEELFES